MALSHFLADALLDHVLMNTAYTSPTTVYLALYSTLPDADDAGGVEVVGGGYARQAVTFGSAVDGVSASDIALTFSNMPGVTVVGVGLHDHVSAGDLLHLAAFTPAIIVVASTDFSVPVADVVAVMR